MACPHHPCCLEKVSRKSFDNLENKGAMILKLYTQNLYGILNLSYTCDICFLLNSKSGVF